MSTKIFTHDAPLMRFSEWGSVPLIYMVEVAATRFSPSHEMYVCAPCATKARTAGEVRDGRVIDVTPHPYFEGAPFECQSNDWDMVSGECDETIESAYGDPEEEAMRHTFVPAPFNPSACGQCAEPETEDCHE